ncbi:MAG: hypothetical protein ACTSVB_04045 [Candidatus Heimdallarchaeaceae archaeon]
MQSKVKAISQKTKAILLEEEEDWLNAEDIWEYAKTIKAGDFVTYSKNDKALTFIRTLKNLPKKKTVIPQSTPRPLDTEIVDKINATYEKLENLENMVGSVIEDVAKIKRQLGVNEADL